MLIIKSNKSIASGLFKITRLSGIGDELKLSNLYIHLTARLSFQPIAQLDNLFLNTDSDD